MTPILNSDLNRVVTRWFESIWCTSCPYIVIPCKWPQAERIFSFSKKTCTLRRSKLSPTTLEALQVLELIYKQDRLNFTEDLWWLMSGTTQYLDL
jgi:hypothetical protein